MELHENKQKGLQALITALRNNIEFDFDADSELVKFAHEWIENHPEPTPEEVERSPKPPFSEEQVRDTKTAIQNGIEAQNALSQLVDIFKKAAVKRGIDLDDEQEEVEEGEEDVTKEEKK